jgi:hypothetical protein
MQKMPASRCDTHLELVFKNMRVNSQNSVLVVQLLQPMIVALQCLTALLA